LKIRVDQKKKKESIRKFYEDDVLSKYMEINQCGIREVEEAYIFDKKNLDNALKLIKKTFFDNKDRIIVDKSKKDDIENGLF
jgi:CTP:phosphocholine cytidylyltransferase-like protein